MTFFDEHSSKIYKKYLAQATIMEIYTLHPSLTAEQLLDILLSMAKEKHEIAWQLKLSDVKREINYLFKLKILVPSDGESLQLSNEGLTALRAGTFQNMASAAHFSYRAQHIAYASFVIAVAALVISLFT